MAFNELLTLTEYSGWLLFVASNPIICLCLWCPQDLHLDPNHYDIARALLDCQQALAHMLSNAPKSLYATFPGPSDWSNFGKASRAEFQMKKRHEQIKKMYA